MFYVPCSMNKECIFCKIIKKEIPSEIVFEDEDVFAFRDIQPHAPVHILIIPKRHIASINELEDSDMMLVGKLIITAKRLAKDFDISEKGYRLLFRTGEWGGQEVPHIHLHLMGGAEMFEDIHAID